MGAQLERDYGGDAVKKNVASQVIGAEMVSATDGSAFTGSVTVYVTGDGGTQAAGSVGSGACTHEGNGYHTYVPAQAETNYNHVAFTFTGTGAIPVTVQVFTGFPQTGDNFARLGAPAGASIAADLATIAGYVDTEIASILSKLGTPAGASVSADIATVTSYVDTEVAAIKTVVDAILVDTAEIGIAGAGLTALATQASVNAVDDYVDTEVAAIKTVVDAIKVKTDSLTFTDAGKVDATMQAAADLKAAVANRIADHLIRRSLATALASADGDVKSGRSLAGAIAKLVNKVAIVGSNLVTYETDDSTALITQAVTTDAAAEPITGVDTA